MEVPGVEPGSSTCKADSGPVTTPIKIAGVLPLHHYREVAASIPGVPGSRLTYSVGSWNRTSLPASLWSFDLVDLSGVAPELLRCERSVLLHAPQAHVPTEGIAPSPLMCEISARLSSHAGMVPGEGLVPSSSHLKWSLYIELPRQNKWTYRESNPDLSNAIAVRSRYAISPEAGGCIHRLSTVFMEHGLRPFAYFFVH